MNIAKRLSEVGNVFFCGFIIEAYAFYSKRLLSLAADRR